MTPRLFLVQWDKAAATARARELRKAGWKVDLETEDGAAAYRRVREKPPALLVVDLTAKPGHGRMTAKSIRESKAGRRLPILFVGGTREDRAAARTAVPGASFCDAPDLDERLDDLRESLERDEDDDETKGDDT